MRDVMRTYKDRLINLGAGNRSLVLRKVYKKRAFDLARILHEPNLTLDGFMAFILERKKGSLQILEDPLKMRSKLMKAIEAESLAEKEAELKSLYNKVEALSPLSESETEVMKKREAEIHEKYDRLLAAEKEAAEKEVQKYMGYANQLNYLVREIEATERETGKYELFIGYPFVEGRFHDGTPLRGPLLLFPIEAVRKDQGWSLKNIEDQDIEINKVLAFGYAKYNGVKLPEFETAFSQLEDFGQDPVAGVLSYLADNQLNFMEGPLNPLESFKDFTNVDFEGFKPGEMHLRPYAILGQFPLSNSIYKDYLQLEKEEVVHRSLESLLLNQEETEGTKLSQKQEAPVLSEHDTFFFTQLDYSQENAIANLLHEENLVIYGPPGTGKSHTIANMISDALCKNKKVLMVSQKRAALDVIYNRLSDLKGKIVLIHDGNKDKKAFYQKVTEAISDLNYDMNKRLVHDTIATGIDEKVEALGAIAQMLMKEQPFGLSLQEMYIKTKGIFDLSDPRFEAYKTFRKDNPFSAYAYQALKGAVDRLQGDDALIHQYTRYRELSDGNPYATGFAHKMDILAYEEVVEGAKKLMTLIGQLKEDHKEDYLPFGQYVSEHLDGLNKQDVTKAAKAYNETLNHALISLENESIFGRLTHHKTIKENRRVYEEEETKYIERFLGYADLLKLGYKALNEFSGHFSKEVADTLKRSLASEFFIQEELNKIINALDDQEKLTPLRTKIQSLDPLDEKILAYAYDHRGEEGQAAMKRWLNDLVSFVILEQISAIEKTEAFNEFYLNFNMYLDNVAAATEMMNQKNQLTKEIAISHWNDQFEVFVDTPLYKEFKRQAEKKRLLWPIRKYMIEFSEILLTLFPCWLLSPETVSDILPLKQDMFDLVIFDEASQIFVENAIPTIYRGKKAVIAGDDKQLQPTSIFTTKYDDFEEEEADLMTLAAFEEESLLDLAKVNYRPVHLNYHYRSRYEELINFSNYAFYQGRLNISPNVKHVKGLAHPPIERILVDGLWEDRKNHVEASRVVDLVATLLQDRKKNETIGIITFNITQKDLIEDLLEARARYDKGFETLYYQEKVRFEGNEDVSIFVKNIENVQGDERDVIIFSVGYAKNPEGKLLVNFGSLSQHGGENRLNVAISRAKRKVYVVTSIEPEALKVDASLNMGPKLFRDYLTYVRAVSNRDEAGVNQVLAGLSEIRRKQSKDEDEFVMTLASALKEAGHQVLTNIGSSESKIDLAILHPVTQEFVLGIECDGKTYRSIPSVRERDLHRKRFLESRGWEITRVWSYDWWRDPSTVIDKISHLVTIMLESEAPELTLEPKETPAISALPQTPEDPFAAWLGDVIYIKDTLSGETFDVHLEKDEIKRRTMSPFKISLLGSCVGRVFEYEGYEYQIEKIVKG